MRARAVLSLIALFASSAALAQVDVSKLQGMGEEYKDFKAADVSAASVHPESISLRVVGGLRYFTKYSGGYVGAVKFIRAGHKESEGSSSGVPHSEPADQNQRKVNVAALRQLQ